MSGLAHFKPIPTGANRLNLYRFPFDLPRRQSNIDKKRNLPLSARIGDDIAIGFKVMQAVFTVILPMVILVMAGYFAAKARKLGPLAIEGLSHFVVDFTIPALLFHSLTAEGEIGGFGVVYAYFIGCVAVYGASVVVARLWRGHALPEAGLFALNATYSNTVLMGVPLIQGAFGTAGLRILTLITAFHSLVMLSLATIFIEAGRNQNVQAPRILAKTLVSAVRNPIIMSVVAGGLWRLSGFTLPAPVEVTIHMLSVAASPCALFMMGATLASLELGSALLEIVGVGIVKMLVMPTVVWILACLVFRLSPLQIAVSTVLAAMPTGVNGFVMAKRYGIYIAQSAGSVLMTTVCSVVTLAGLLLIFSERGF
jgi:hypothetical protein